MTVRLWISDNDGEILSIRQGATTVNYEFQASQGGGGVTLRPSERGACFELRIPAGPQ